MGSTHEQSAIESYTINASKSHEGLKVTTAGLFIDCESPFVGASPDGIIVCTCCGKGVLEVKWTVDSQERPYLLLLGTNTT